MNAVSLLDIHAAAVVLGGTLLATLLRCGLTDCRIALGAIGVIGRRSFDAEQVRAELAAQVREIRQDGLLRAEPHHFGDSEFDEAANALIGSRSLSALHRAHDHHRLMRLDASERAVRTLAQAAELAPVFGLAGTLLSLSQLPSDGLAAGQYAGAVSLAVLTTLYGLLLANLVFAPLSRVIDRRAQAEERDRQTIVDWLESQLESAMPRQRPSGLAEVA